MSTSQPQADLKALVRRYFDAIERGDEAAVFALVGPGVVQHEYPNRLIPAGAVRDRAAMVEAFRRGRAAVASQRYVIEREVVDGDSIALEVTWAATLAAKAGSLGAGDEMRARFGVFIRAEGGRIVDQRNYDCFEPF